MKPQFIKEDTWLSKVRTYMKLMGWRWVSSAFRNGVPAGWVKYYPPPNEVEPSRRDGLTIIALYGDAAWKTDVRRAMKMTIEEGFTLIKVK